MSWNGKHQDIAGVQSGDLNDIIEEGKDLTDTDFDQGEIESIPDLVRTVQDVHRDLEEGDIKGALEKLGWYITNGPMSGVRTEEEVIAYLNENVVPGAFQINSEKAAEMHLGISALYRGLQQGYKLMQQQKQAQSIMYK